MNSRPTAQEVVIVVGAVTAFFAATVGLVQNDIKRVIAYSTCSQLGYMFVAMGVGAYGVGMFHLFTHAFFKALLFLGSGSVIHAMSNEQDIRKMGGLAPHIRVTWLMMLIGTLSLTGFPYTAGYFSKDASHRSLPSPRMRAPAGFAFALLVIAAFCTSFYSWRLMFLTFHGESAACPKVMSHVHESPQVMLVPLYVLAAGALSAGFLFAPYFIGHDEAHFWGRGSSGLLRTRSSRRCITFRPGSYGRPSSPWCLGFALAYLFYIRRTDLPGKLAAQHWPLYSSCSTSGISTSSMTSSSSIRPNGLAASCGRSGDGWLIDGFGPDGVSARVVDVTQRVVRLQTGYLFHYAFAMLIGVAALVTWFMFGGAH